MGMYRSLVVQLLQKLPDLQEVLGDPVYDTYLALPDQSDCYSWGVDLLQTLFTQVIKKLENRRLFCVVDGLDECDESQVVAMTYYIEDLLENAVRIGSMICICLSSRHYPCIDIRIGQKVTLENQVGHREDLERYTRSNLRLTKGNYTKTMVAGILKKAAGVFIWAVVVVKMLNREIRRGRTFTLQRKLDETPTELSTPLRDMLKKHAENMEEFLLCIQWILYAKQPLKCEELYLAIISGLNDPDSASWGSEFVDLDHLQRFVLTSSKGLAEVIKSNTVQFIHESVRDFLMKENGLTDLHLGLGENFRCLSHDRLRQCCQIYLSAAISYHQPLKSLEKASHNIGRYSILEIFEKFPFLAYATRHVLYHANEAADGLLQDEFMREFRLRVWIQLQNAGMEHLDCLYSQNQSLLYILAERGLAKPIETYLQKDMNINAQSEREEHLPFSIALANDHRDVIAALLQQDKVFSQEDTITEALK